MENSVLDFTLVHELLETLTLDVLLLSELLERGLGGDNDGDGPTLLRGGIDANVADELGGAVY